MSPRDTRSDPSELLSGLLRDIGTDVKKLGDLASRHDESLKGLWREVRDEIKPSIRELVKEQRELFSDHQEQCPALQAFYTKASKDTPVRPFRSIQPSSANGHKALIYLATGLGVIATTIIVLLKKLGIF
jgi:hypothetical protein